MMGASEWRLTLFSLTTEADATARGSPVYLLIVQSRFLAAIYFFKRAALNGLPFCHFCGTRRRYTRLFSR